MKIIILILIFFSLETHGQENLINYQYDKKIDSLHLKFKKINLSQNGIQAFRIQIAFASTKNEINTMKLNFMKKFPNVPIYLSYSAPYYKLRVGNFRTKFEAEKSKGKLIKNYPGSYIVSEYIKLNLLN
tara:strand:+ start:431 stop:817 length:387 start_codon:yes stop_codon:yes gene_type:complete